MGLLFLLFWAAAELFVAIEIASLIGVLATVLLLIASWPLGGWAMRSQGRAVWRRFGDAVGNLRRSLECLKSGLPGVVARRRR